MVAHACKSWLLRRQEVRRVEVVGQSGQKVSETPPQQTKLGMVVHTHHPSYVGGVNRRIMAEASPGKNLQHYPKNN
jgi:hypothetical protein